LLEINEERSICLNCGTVIAPNLSKRLPKQETLEPVIDTTQIKLDYNEWENYVTISGSVEKNIADALTTITTLGVHFSARAVQST
jgi:hypothetical protein